MPRDPRDISTQAEERRQRRLGVLEDQKDPIRLRVGSGPSGAKGESGRPAGLRYKFNTNTAESDPGSGKLKLNNASLSAATILWISETDADANGVAATLAAWDDSTSTVRGTLTIRSVATGSDIAIYSVTGAITDKGTYDAFTIAHKSSSGAFSSEEEITVEFSRTGDKGDEGKEGATGGTGGEGPPGASTAGDWKDSVRVATTANVTISTALNPGDTIDGVVLAENDRVLVREQTTTKENGIWVVKAVPVRSTDADGAGELSGGTMVYVEAGTQAGRVYVIDTAGSITPGTTSHVWRLHEPRLVAFGRVSSAGAKTLGEGFTVAKTGTGGYKITFTIKAPAVPAVYITPDSSTAIVAWTAKNTTTEFTEVSIWNESGLVALDYPFSFRVEC